MRILVVTSHDEEIGGVASVIGDLAEHMVSRGHKIFFLNLAKNVFLKEKTTKLGFPGFDLRLQMPFGDRHPALSLFAFLMLFPIAMWQILWLLRKHRIDVINVHCPTDCFVYFALCKRILSAALIISVHGSDILPGGKPQVYYSGAFSFLLSSSDFIVAPSRGFREIILSMFPQLNGKTIFIHNGVNLRGLDVPWVKPTANFPTPYILCISAYKEQKAVDVLIRAFKRVHEMNSSITLVVVGSGPLHQELYQLATVLGLANAVQLRGPASRAQIATLLRNCEVFALPSRFETFGIVILEAMACKKPVIATKVGGIPEIIDSGKNGILVEPDNSDALAEALITVLNNQDLRLGIASSGYVTVCQHFRSENMGSAYETIFGNLAHNWKAKPFLRRILNIFKVRYYP